MAHLQAAALQPCRCGHIQSLSSIRQLSSRNRLAGTFVPFTAARGHRRRPIAAAGPDTKDSEKDDEFDARLAKLTKNKSVPGGRGKSKETPYSVLQDQKNASKSGGKERDWGKEDVFLETAPHRGDLAVNIAFGFTLLWLPLTAAAIGRAAFVKYKFTDKRVSVITTAPWKDEELSASYSRMDSVVSIGRGVGAWGDMVVTLKDKSKIEMRALPRHKEVEKYVNEQIKLANASASGKSGGKKAGDAKGFGSA